MNEWEGIFKRNHKNWCDVLNKIDALSSTVKEIQHEMEHEGVSKHIIDSYTTINNAIMGIVYYANNNVIMTAYDVYKEKAIFDSLHE